MVLAVVISTTTPQFETIFTSDGSLPFAKLLPDVGLNRRRQCTAPFLRQNHRPTIAPAEKRGSYFPP
jgi:hypothetical protein